MSGQKILDLFSTHARMSCMSHIYYFNSIVKSSLTDTRMLTFHLAMGHNMQPVGITNYEVTMGGASMTDSFIMCKYLTKDVVIGLDIQQIYRIGCNWTEDGKVYLHHGQNILINSPNVNTDNPKLTTVGTLQIPALVLASIPARKQDLYPRCLPCL